MAQVVPLDSRAGATASGTTASAATNTVPNLTAPANMTAPNMHALTRTDVPSTDPRTSMRAVRQAAVALGQMSGTAPKKADAAVKMAVALVIVGAVVGALKSSISVWKAGFSLYSREALPDDATDDERAQYFRESSIMYADLGISIVVFLFFLFMTFISLWQVLPS